MGSRGIRLLQWVLGLAIGLFVGLGAPGLDRNGVPVEEVAVEIWKEGAAD